MRKGLIIILLVVPFLSISQKNLLLQFYWQPELFTSGKVYCYSSDESDNLVRYLSFSIINNKYCILTWDREFKLKEIEEIDFNNKRGVQLRNSYCFYGRGDTLKLSGHNSYGELFPYDLRILEIHWLKCYINSVDDSIVYMGDQKAKNFKESDSLLIFNGTTSYLKRGGEKDSLTIEFKKKTTFKKGMGLIREESFNSKDTIEVYLSEIIDNKNFENKKQMYYAKTDSLLRAFNIDKQQLQKALNEDKFIDSSLLVYNMIMDSIELRKKASYSARLIKALSIKKIREQADSIKFQADELSSIIEKYKGDLIYKMTGGLDSDSIPIGKDDRDAGYKYLAISNNGERGKILENKIDNFRITLLSIVKDTAVAHRIEMMLATDDSQEEKWIGIISNHLPMAAVTANLTLLQTYIRNAEAESVEYLANELEKK